jgi:hypothetical protein
MSDEEDEVDLKLIESYIDSDSFDGGRINASDIRDWSDEDIDIIIRSLTKMFLEGDLEMSFLAYHPDQDEVISDEKPSITRCENTVRNSEYDRDNVVIFVSFWKDGERDLSGEPPEDIYVSEEK